MGQRFVACDREQPFLIPPDVREWLPPRHLAWFVIDAVAEMALDAFYAAYRIDGRSRPACDPVMMVALLLYAYARGIRSSRVIERACDEDVAFRVLAAQQQPDHATIARFVERHEHAIAGLFGEVLTLRFDPRRVALAVEDAPLSGGPPVEGAPAREAASERGPAPARRERGLLPIADA